MLKKSIALLLALIFFLVPASACADNSEEMLGDVNFDGKINQYDYILVRRSYFGTYPLSSAEFAAADVNKDEVVNQYDYILISRHYFGTYTIEQTVNGGNDDENNGGNNGENNGGEYTPELVQIPNVVSLGKLYTISPAPASNYEDTYNTELTDGVFDKSAGYTSGVFCGLNSNFEIVVDLREDGKQLNKFELSYLSVNEAGVNAPASASIMVSDDSNSWKSLGEMNLPQFVSGTVQRAVLELGTELSARYVKFEVKRKASWVFIDEVFVYSSIPKYAEKAQTKLENAYFTTSLTEKQLQRNIESVKSGKVFNSANGTVNVAEKCGYTVKNGKLDPRTEDTAATLTDGSVPGSAFEREVWVGFESDKGFEITVNLGNLRDDIYSFSLFAFNRETSNVVLPYYIDFAVSTDGNSFTTVGRSYGIESVQENYEYRLSLDKCVKARYVRFTVSERDGYAWFEEICIYANTNEKVIPESMYGDFDFVTTTIPSYWTQGSDYNTTQNLILGKPQEITPDNYLAYQNTSKGNSPESLGLLTDGKVTTDDYCYNGQWFHFTAGGGRSVFYDFGHISAVSSFSVRFLDYGDWAIEIPETLKLVLSENGEDWYLAASIIPKSNGSDFLNVTGTLDKAYRARYAMIYMDVGSHVFLDEITVNGKKNVSSASKLDSLSKYKVNKGEYSDHGYAAPSKDLLGGAEDICLIYHNGSVKMNEEFFKPYVGYVDQSGKIVDTLFDGYLFLPTTGTLPSGGRPYGTNTASDWNGLFDALFTSGINFDALNKTAETTKKSLGLDELKLKVYVAIPHMDDTLYNFGDIDLDGDNESLTTLEGRIYVAQTYAERVIKKFNANGYKNLELCGFYWFHETISGNDVETSKAVNEMFDKLGYQLFWIPYFNASGFSNWEELGFDVACYQPNYAFSAEVDVSRLEHATIAAKAYGMCIELEIDNAALYDDRFFEKYMNYLSKGIDYGYMDGAIHMYYQSTNIFGDASRSTDSKVRLIYDYTYQFIKGTLDPIPEKPKNMRVECDTNRVFSGTLANDSEQVTQFRLASSASHGVVTVTKDGKFVYYPNKDFKGTDTFTYQISHRLGWSEEVTVTIEVE